MLDINFIRENTEKVKKAVLDKGIKLNIDELLGLDQERRSLISKVDKLRSERNQAAKSKDIEAGKKIKGELVGLEQHLRELEEKYNNMMLYVPNIPSMESPVGEDSKSNQETKRWGEIGNFSFPIKDHIELGKFLDIIDLDQGVAVSGFRGYYLKNEGAMLHWAILQLALAKIIGSGFQILVPPTLLHEKALIGSGHFPFGEDNVYQISNSDTKLFLAGTSEPSLLAYYMDKQIPEENLPIKLCALTQCYRSEVGDYGKDTRGLYRVHEFSKVEQVVICKNLEESEEFFQEMQTISEQLLQDLKLPYRVMNISTGDMGAGKYKMNDLEVWMPSRKGFGETHSNSNLTDWQARRLNIKYKSGTETRHCFTLNNTVIASPRILIAILENYQQKDGSVKVPEILIPYTIFSEINPK